MGAHSTVQAAGSAELMPCDPPRAGHLPSLSQALGSLGVPRGSMLTKCIFRLPDLTQTNKNYEIDLYTHMYDLLILKNIHCLSETQKFN